LSIKTKPHGGHGNTLRRDSIFKHTNTCHSECG
jgi:hypothetical protein